VGELDGIVKEFVIEARENLDQLERDLIELESHPSSRDTLASIFRTVHTIKGAAGFVGLSRVESLAHTGESVLSRLRDGSLVINPAIASGLLALADCMRGMLTRVDETGAEGATDDGAVIEQLRPFLEGGTVPGRMAGDGALDPGEIDRPAQSSSNVRVSVEQLDSLMNLVGELVLARNEIVQFSAAQQSTVLLSSSQRLNAITTQLQEGIVKTRMQPIDNVWKTLPRVVRDAAQFCGKRVRLEMEGNDTELDRTLIEAIKDPLNHAVRNCIDHGIEAPEKRLLAGKSPEGRLLLRAFHEGGQVTIEISDDGAGVDVAAIKRQALERRLITPEQSRSMSDEDAINLIFAAGLSTAASVTSMSGRGVGMDVVKTNVEQIGGKVTIKSKAGAGTTLTMRIPLTLAIMRALVVTSGLECYAIPQANILELVRLEGEAVRAKVEMIGDAAVYRLRGKLLPLLWMQAELTPERRSRWSGRPNEAPLVNIVILQANRLTFGLVVDEVNDTQEIVVKPLGRQVRGIPIFAGATLIGNGSVVLILDVAGLATRANVAADVHDGQSMEPGAMDSAAGRQEALLLVAGPDGTRVAVPLLQVTRLEEFSSASIETVGDRDVVQYLGGVLPLVDLEGRWLDSGKRRGGLRATSAFGLQTLVYSQHDGHVGVVVDQILDTVESSLANLRPATRAGVAGSLVIDGRVTEILDLDVICAGLIPAIQATAAVHAAAEAAA
jgi:two-component system chemotaxis sensor kinase CheA